MKLLFTPEWLRQRIESDPDMDTEAGLPSEALESINIFLPQESSTEKLEEDVYHMELKQAFGTFVRNLRLMKKLTIESLAKSASVDVSELVLIETDTHYQARPRTVVQLANFYHIEVRRMIQFSGITQTSNDGFEEEAIKFADKSSGVSSLNNEEQQVLNEFVKYLNQE